MSNALQEFEEQLLSSTLPYIVARTSSISDSIMVSVSADKKENWQNGIFQNSRYLQFSISPSTRWEKDNSKQIYVFEVISGRVASFRKKTGSAAAMKKQIEILVAAFENL